jgi:ABC-type lipoprotein export system ATPase subunit
MIHVSGLSFSYTPTHAIRFPDFHIAKGEHCLLLGESGSGKTTLLHLLGGLLRSYQGSIRLQDTELASLKESALDSFRGKNIGFVFQKNHLIQALSVEQNLKLAPFLAHVPVDETRLNSVLTELGLADKRHARIHELSLGQAQRVAIARAVLNHPPVLLADEPTSALDDTNCEKVISLLLTMAAHNDATLVIATHDHRIRNRFSKQIILS